MVGVSAKQLHAGAILEGMVRRVRCGASRPAGSGARELKRPDYLLHGGLTPTDRE